MVVKSNVKKVISYIKWVKPFPQKRQVYTTLYDTLLKVSQFIVTHFFIIMHLVNLLSFKAMRLIACFS